MRSSACVGSRSLFGTWILCQCDWAGGGTSREIRKIGNNTGQRMSIHLARLDVQSAHVSSVSPDIPRRSPRRRKPILDNRLSNYLILPLARAKTHTSWHNLQTQTLRTRHNLPRNHLLPYRRNMLIHALDLCNFVNMFQRHCPFCGFVADFPTAFIYA